MRFLEGERKHTPEILRFFQMFPGQTLLIEGRPGTGKTILSLEILRENGLYVSTRVTKKNFTASFHGSRGSFLREA